MPKFTLWESLTPEPPPLASNHIRNLSRITPQSKMIKPLLNHQSSVCCDRFLPTSCLCFLLAQEVLHLILTHLLSLITGTNSFPSLMYRGNLVWQSRFQPYGLPCNATKFGNLGFNLTVCLASTLLIYTRFKANGKNVCTLRTVTVIYLKNRWVIYPVLSYHNPHVIHTLCNTYQVILLPLQ